jgi:predicted metal-dependent peptidase
MSDIETKLAAARTRLILDKPFLGALVLRLPMIAAGKWCRTTATDARAFYYNADYINDLSLDQTQFVLAHEALHCALSHFARRQHRQKARWDVACDLAINPLLIADGLRPTPDALMLHEFEGMTAEEIYPCLDENDDLQPQDDHLYDDEEREGGQRGGSGGAGDPSRGGESKAGEGSGAAEPHQSDESHTGADRPPPLRHEEREQLAVQWRQRMAGAAQQALQAGKLSGPLARLIDHLLQPQLPWRTLLARYLSLHGRDDYNYLRPSRREGAAILPSLRSNQIEIAVALDTSGSISPEEIRQFVSEVDALKGQVRARVALFACDSALAPEAPWNYEPWEELRLPREFAGGGSTDFRPVFDWLQREGRRPELLVYFTDGEGRFPEREPDFPVLWLVKGRARVPWGQRVQLN